MIKSQENNGYWYVENDSQVCDIAYFPTCAGSHWFLFIVDLNKRKVLVVDSLRDDNKSGTYLRKMSPQEYYIMVTFEIFFILH